MVKRLDIPNDLKDKLKFMLLKHNKLFSGGLGKAKVKPVDVQLKPGFKPYKHKGFYSVPKMLVEALKKIEKIVSATAIDLSQGYYHIPMSKEAQKILSPVLPWGSYSYKRLPMV